MFKFKTSTLCGILVLLYFVALVPMFAYATASPQNVCTVTQPSTEPETGTEPSCEAVFTTFSVEADAETNHSAANIVPEEIVQTEPEISVHTTIPEPVHEHDYKETTFASTCTESGYTLFTCACGDSYKGDHQDKLPHNYVSKVVHPTAETGGYTTHTCTACGAHYQDNYKEPITSGSTSESEETYEVDLDTSEDETIVPGQRNPQYADFVEDYGDCPNCGRKLWTSTYTTGCFTFLRDTVCDCGVLVHAMECHHH